ncbi:hypothetical protein Bca101_024724 [Brassica carinata]
MAHQEEGWPLGLRPVNARIGGLTRETHPHEQVSAGSISFSSLHSPSPSSPSSSDLDSQSFKSMAEPKNGLRFLLPKFRSVENHIYYLSQCLLNLGHKVSVLLLSGPGTDVVTVVVISRLVYRKGADLLVEVIPQVCRLYPNVPFVVRGDGPKHVRLEEMREKHSPQDRVEMLGAVPHSRVRSVLVTGHIFLNSSLTQAFCIAILEAANCGLLTVSTRVGGVPEAYDMVVLAEPDPDNMVRAIEKAISILPSINPEEMHNRMKKMYSWQDVAKRTENVYDRALKCSNRRINNIKMMVGKFLSRGASAGKIFCMVMIIDYLLWRLLELLQPDDDIEEAPDINFRH